MPDAGITFSRHILNESRKHPDLCGPLAPLLAQMIYSAKVLSREISRAALVGKLGLVGEKNSTGDSQKKLDIYTNDVVVEAFVNTELVWALVSEELEEAKCISCDSDAEYVLCIDPLDGSSNVDINGDVGTIFGIYQRGDTSGGIDSVFMRKGSEQVAAGYVLYGASTMFVYTIGHGVHGFTLDQGLGEFLMSHENIKCPPDGKSYSANLSHLPQWSTGIRKYIETLNDPAVGQTYSMRYVGALVSDFHRCLLEGGIYFYPGDTSNPDGKLRLLYECAPLAMLAEQAGGSASDGAQRILDIQATSLHQRTPLAIGSSNDVATYDKFFKEKHSEATASL